MSARRHLLRGLALALGGIVAFTALPAAAQPAASPFTAATRYDAERRVTGTIAPDPDGAGPIAYAAVRNSYDPAGRLVKIEKGELASWQAEAVAPSAWTGFTVFETTDVTYDGLDRKIREDVTTGSKITVTQYGYDPVGRLKCTAVRMNPAEFATLTADACALDTPGSQGPDRITQNSYDPVGQLVKIRKAVGTPLEQDHVNYGYTANGRQRSVIDANGNKATMTYDGFDRLIAWSLPSKTAVGSVASCTLTPVSEAGGIVGPPETRAAGDDCEKYAWDANGNRAKLMKRDGSVIGYGYDPLNRMTLKDIPGGSAADVYYAYDSRGLQTEARFGSLSGQGVSSSYDGFGRLVSSTTSMGSARTLTYQWDADGNRTRVTHPDGQYFGYEYDGLDRMTHLRENGGTAVSYYVYRSDGQLGQLTRPNSANTSFSYGSDRRLSAIAHDFASTASDVTFGFSGYNPADQVTQRTRDNDSFAFPGYVTASTSYTANGLNQYSAVGGAAPTYDLNGNMTSDGTTAYTYDVENRLVTASGGVTLGYDPLGRLQQVTSASGTRQFLYDGDELVAEFNGSGALLRRWAHGQGEDDPLAWYEGATVGGGNRRLLHADHQGSIIAFSSNAGNATINRYDEYGVPAVANVGVFQYTGQAWLPELQMYYYKARLYAPKLGRFLQIDPIGYDNQINLYVYVGNDPINKVDPSGLSDLNLFADDAYSPHEAAERVKINGVFTITAHASYKGILDSTQSGPRGPYLSPEELLDRAIPRGYKKGNPTFLLACGLASATSGIPNSQYAQISFAMQYARASQGDVIASPGNVCFGLATCKPGATYDPKARILTMGASEGFFKISPSGKVTYLGNEARVDTKTGRTTFYGSVRTGSILRSQTTIKKSSLP